MAQTQVAHIEQVFKKERGSLLGFIRKRVSRLEDAEDILQDVFFQFISAYDSIESLDKTTSWLFSVARNKITDRYRKKKPDAWSDLGFMGKNEGSEVLMLEDILPDFKNTPEDVYARNMIWESIELALEEMPAEQRQVMLLHEFEDKSFKEISEITGVSVNTLLSRKRYAILFLRKKLQELYDEL
jgi:RNA polymerase sigma factor (sigma-70 family)